jgi:hypothetical protein
VKLLLVVDGLEAAHLSEAGLWLAEIAARAVTRGHRVEVVCRKALEPCGRGSTGVIVPPDRVGVRSGVRRSAGALPDAIHLASRGPFGGRIAEILPAAGAARRARLLADLPQ